MIYRFKKLISDVREGNPNIQVFVSAILPRDVSLFPGAKNKLTLLDMCNDRAKKVNDAIRLMDDVVLIEHPRFGSDRYSANRVLLFRDGLHLTPDGVKEMKLDIETAIRFRLKPTTRRAPSFCRPVLTTPLSVSVPSTSDESVFTEDDFPALPTKAQVATQKKEVPIQKKEETTQKKEDSTQKKEVTTQKKEVTTQKKEAPTQKKEVTTQKKEAPTHKKEVTTQKKEAPTQKKKVTTQKKEVTTQKKEAPTQKREVTTQKKKAPTQKKEVTTQKKEAPTQKKEVTTQKKEAPTQK